MLLLDAGNSRCKWGLVQDGQWVRQGAVAYAADELERTLAALPPLSRILVSNVAGDAMERRLRAACADRASSFELVRAGAVCCGVSNGYAQPDQLGSDRWAALIGAWRRVRGACLVVNCGTATTVDALSAQGEFLGGLILPGIGLMQRSLAVGTAQLAEARGEVQNFPRNTADAIHSGAICATVGAVKHQFDLLRARARAGEMRCLLGGGAAEAIETQLDLPLERVDNLVLEGLQVIGEAGAR